MEPSDYVYQVPGDALFRIMQAIGFLGIFVLCVMLFCLAIVYGSFRIIARAAANRYQSGNEILFINEDIRYGFGLEDYHVDEGIAEIEEELKRQAAKDK